MSYRLEELTGVRRGSSWAIGLGVLAVVGGALIAGVGVVLPSRGMVVGDMGFGLLTAFVGAASIYLGVRLRNPATARPAHFTALLWGYGVTLGLILLGDAASLASGEGVSGLLTYPLVGWALLMFSRGRRELRDADAEREVEGAVAGAEVDGARG